MKNLTDQIEALILIVLLSGLKVLPLQIASSASGILASLIGPLTKRHRIAKQNLSLALPEISVSKRNLILKGMWNNLGRTFGELAHLKEFDCYKTNGYVEVSGVEHLDDFRDDGVGGIAFSAHLGWWDLSALALNQRGLNAHMIFRAENNPYSQEVTIKARSYAGSYLKKGPQAAKEILGGLKQGKHYGMLLDQKMNDGISVPFFGHNAMTAPAAAQFAIRDNIPLLPVRCERLGGIKFRISFYPPLEIIKTGNRDEDVLSLTREINRTLESWIRERPEQWLWIHRRWPDKTKSNNI